MKQYPDFVASQKLPGGVSTPAEIEATFERLKRKMIEKGIKFFHTEVDPKTGYARVMGWAKDPGPGKPLRVLP